MNIIGNIIWAVLVGFWVALALAIGAAVFAITVVGMPWALQAIKVARFALWPMGYEVRKRQP